MHNYDLIRLIKYQINNIIAIGDKESEKKKTKTIPIGIGGTSDKNWILGAKHCRMTSIGASGSKRVKSTFAFLNLILKKLIDKFV